MKSAIAPDTALNRIKQMSTRPATVRPAHLDAPDYLSKSPPVPKPEPLATREEPDPDRLDPVRYGDWEFKGLAIDF